VEISFQCNQPKTREEAARHRAACVAGIINKFIPWESPKVVDAGGGNGYLGEHFEIYKNWDLADGHDIQDSIPIAQVVVFMEVLEHVVDLKKVLDNVKADYVLIGVPRERNRLPSPDHVRRVTINDIQALTDWELVGKWFWVLRPRLWRLRYFFPVVSVFAEDEISLWRVKHE